jgi:hypothetical protein
VEDSDADLHQGADARHAQAPPLAGPDRRGRHEVTAQPGHMQTSALTTQDQQARANTAGHRADQGGNRDAQDPVLSSEDETSWSRLRDSTSAPSSTTRKVEESQCARCEHHRKHEPYPSVQRCLHCHKDVRTAARLRRKRGPGGL